MIKFLSQFCLVLLFFFAVLWSANQQSIPVNKLKMLKVGMAASSLEFLGSPVTKNKKQIIYLLPDSSSLVISLFNNKVTGAFLKLKKPMNVNDSIWGEMDFVKIKFNDSNFSSALFYAGSPVDGRVFRINHDGFIESISWIQPFSSVYPRKNLQALYHEISLSQLGKI